MARDHREDNKRQQGSRRDPADRYRSPMNDQREDAADNWARPDAQPKGKRRKREAALPVNDVQGTGAQQTAAYNWQANGGYFLEETPADYAVPLNEHNDPGYQPPQDKDWYDDPFDQGSMPAPPSTQERSVLVNAMHDGNVTFTPDGRPVILPPRTGVGPEGQTGYAALQNQRTMGATPPGGTPPQGQPAAAPGPAYANTGAAPASARHLQGSPVQQAQAQAQLEETDQPQQKPGAVKDTDSMTAVGTAGHKGFGSRHGSRLAVRVALIVLVLVVAAGALLTSVFRVREVEVRGNSRIPAETIRQLSGVQPGVNVLNVLNNEKAVREGIESNPYLRFVNVVTTSPWSVVITVREREEAAYLNYCGISYVIDARGVVLRKSDLNEAMPGLIRVEGLQVKGAVPGSRISVANPDNLDLYVNIMLELKAMSLRSRVTEMYLGDLDNLYMATNDGFSVRLGRSYDVHAKLRATFLAVDKIHEMQDSGEIPPSQGTIDVSAPETPGYIPENGTRSGIAYFTVNDNCYTLDSRGLVMTENLNAGWMPGLLRLDGLDVVTDINGLVKVGAKVTVMQESRLALYIEIAMALEQNDRASQAASLNLTDPGRLVLTTKDNFTIVLGNPADLTVKVVNAFRTLDEIYSRQEKGMLAKGTGTIDMTDPTSPTYLPGN